MKKKNIINFSFENKKINNYFKNCNKGHIIAAFFAIFSLIIVWKMFSYTVINYTFYHTLADKQQI
jgi:hypothetical protein